MVGKMNSRVTIQTQTATKDSGGGVSYAAVELYTAWANVENRTGQANFNEGQRQDNYDYKITIRQYDTYAVTTKNTALYGTKKLKINSVQIINEGKKSYLVLRCILHGSN
jgi:SPP1 family predicted phage head-tail adaptor